MNVATPVKLSGRWQIRITDGSDYDDDDDYYYSVEQLPNLCTACADTWLVPAHTMNYVGPYSMSYRISNSI